MVDAIMPNLLIELLASSLILSCVIMVLIQKCKKLSFISKSWQVWFLNLIFSFLIGIPFSITFYKYSINNSIWVSFFSFIGASSIYETLKSQNFINYKPASVDEVTLNKANEIRRDN